MPDGIAPTDPGPAETAERGVEVVFEWDGTATGIVGFGEGGRHAVELAAANPTRVERLVLVSTEPAEEAPASVDAKTLLLFGSLDGGQRRATWWKNRIGGRIEMVPRGGHEILAQVWPRVLSHLAPGSTR